MKLKHMIASLSLIVSAASPLSADYGHGDDVLAIFIILWIIASFIVISAAGAVIFLSLLILRRYGIVSKVRKKRFAACAAFTAAASVLCFVFRAEIVNGVGSIVYRLLLMCCR